MTLRSSTRARTYAATAALLAGALLASGLPAGGADAVTPRAATPDVAPLPTAAADPAAAFGVDEVTQLLRQPDGFAFKARMTDLEGRRALRDPRRLRRRARLAARVALHHRLQQGRHADARRPRSPRVRAAAGPGQAPRPAPRRPERPRARQPRATSASSSSRSPRSSPPRGQGGRGSARVLRAGADARDLVRRGGRRDDADLPRADRHPGVLQEAARRLRRQPLRLDDAVLLRGVLRPVPGARRRLRHLHLGHSRSATPATTAAREAGEVSVTDPVGRHCSASAASAPSAWRSRPCRRPSPCRGASTTTTATASSTSRMIIHSGGGHEVTGDPCNTHSHADHRDEPGQHRDRPARHRRRDPQGRHPDHDARACSSTGS